MSGTSDRKRLFERLKESLEEGIQFARGKLTLRTTVIPDPPPAFHAQDVVRLRKRLGLSQMIFAQILNVSAKTVQSWEQGARKPSQVSLRLLQVVKEEPKTVLYLVGMRNVSKPFPKQGQRDKQTAGA
jgi:putative transcriptional regulator